MNKMVAKLVSVIVPVYNVEQYVDECIASLVNQSYRNIEIILINDGSTDNSGEKCKEWECQDERIRYFEQVNCGLSATRNRGMSISRGAYIAFVDSDDWVEKTYIEKMFDQIEKEKADLAICDYYKFDEMGKQQYVRCNSLINKCYSKEEYLLLSNPTACNKMISKEFIDKHNIKFFDGLSEDTAIFTIFTLMSNKVTEVKEPLYYYRKYRANSITASIENRKRYSQTYNKTILYWQTKETFERYKKILYKYFLKWSSNSLAPCIGKVDYDKYREIRLTFYEFLKKNFDFRENNSVAVWGGYNLSKIARLTSLFADPYLRLQFSSICALGTKERVLSGIHHRNEYRNFMIERELADVYFEVLDNEKPDYIMIDFLEERHDILRIRNELYTYSDALRGCYDVKDLSILPRENNDIELIWQEKCNQFINELKKRFIPSRIILVKNYLATSYSDGIDTEVFQDINKIKKINKILEGYYSYFERHLDGVIVIDCSGEKEYVTDKYYEYGCVPEHLNDSINYRMAKEIDKEISNEWKKI